MNTIKKCPRCGSKSYSAYEEAYWFTCRICGFSSAVKPTLHEAIEAWNKGEEDNEGKTERKCNYANESARN